MPDIEKVIQGLERCLKHTCPAIYSKEYEECEYTVGLYCGQDKLLHEALELLKEQQPRVLSYDEMKTMIGKPVYVEEPKRNADPHCYWGLVVEGEEPPKEGGYNYPGGVDFNVEVGLNVYDGDLYMVDIGCGWRAWTAEPTDEQRMNTPWEGR